MGHRPNTIGYALRCCSYEYSKQSDTRTYLYPYMWSMDSHSDGKSAVYKD